MPLKQKLTAAEHQALASDTDRANYKLVGSDFVLDVEGVDNITSLTSALATERSARQTAETNLKKFEGVDVERYKTLTAAEQGQQLGKLTDKGQYDKALETVNQQHEAKQKELQQKLDAQAIDHALSLGLSAAGVIPARLKDALQIARPMVAVHEGSVGVLGADGKVDLTKPLDQWLGQDFKKDRAYLYAPNGNSGSGAQNGTNTATGDKPTKTRAEANALPPAEKMAYMEQVSAGKAVLTD